MGEKGYGGYLKRDILINMVGYLYETRELRDFSLREN